MMSFLYGVHNNCCKANNLTQCITQLTNATINKHYKKTIYGMSCNAFSAVTVFSLNCEYYHDKLVLLPVEDKFVKISNGKNHWFNTHG